MGSKKKSNRDEEIIKYSTEELTDTELTELINVMIVIDPPMKFCTDTRFPIAAHGINLSGIECMSSVILHEKDATSDKRIIYLLLRGTGMIELSEAEFNDALNAKGMSKPLKAFLKLYFHVEKPKGDKPKKAKNKKEEAK